MATAPSIKSGWGVSAAQLPVGQLSGGLNAVIPNVGLVIQIPPSGFAQRVAKLGWRIDLAPDQPVGTLVSPTRWRVTIVQGQIQDVTAWQTQAFGAAAARLDIPKNYGNSAPLPVLHDEWLDLSSGAPGLNVLFTRDFADAGPSVDPTAYLSALLVPLIDAAFPATPPNPAANQPSAIMTLELYGTTATAGAFGGPAGAAAASQPSLPRYDSR
jgi:hypothetical protein